MPRSYEQEKEGLLLEEAALAFGEATGLHACSAPPASAGPRSLLDGLMHFDLGHGRKFTMPVEVKVHMDRFATVAKLKEAQEKLGEPLLLVTNSLSQVMAERLRENQISFLDTAGNVSLNHPEALVYVVGRRRSERATSSPRGRTAGPKQLEVLYALIAEPRLVSASYRAIAAVAQVALSTVNVAIDDFVNRRLLVAGADGKRQFGDWERVVDEWATLYPIKLKPKLQSRRFSASNPDWWKSIDLARHGAVFSAEVAADKLTQHLRPERVVLYAHTTSPKELIMEGRLRADAKGEVEIFQAFWSGSSPKPAGTPAGVAHPVLVYADLLESGEARSLDVARLIREKYLAHRPQPFA
ncbi:type IV toxin-antitoxin system AbiEi family antitoxin [Cupriavidus basilensis]|uniref:Type IV toxin-antitoxin system AbiEi family antitoxin n=1 Tax=Cupriavidus basilensis TaxID=68895 RepID=A0ABT6B226_9BURK|nr:type IV toxin-antitoxin system AbiEi family antitoxin [Cupriavidus basilensis]MDF3838779.1 type IV toxin-antitoxin system AbiEi family antitoxin [Cupriavidus basilensis]